MIEHDSGRGKSSKGGKHEMQGGEPPALEVFDDTTASSLNIKEFAVGEDRRLRMNGRAVFSFSATQVPKALTEVLARNELTWPDVDRIILHQGSRFIVETIGSRIGDASPGGGSPALGALARQPTDLLSSLPPQRASVDPRVHKE